MSLSELVPALLDRVSHASDIYATGNPFADTFIFLTAAGSLAIALMVVQWVRGTNGTSDAHEEVSTALASYQTEVARLQREIAELRVQLKREVDYLHLDVTDIRDNLIHASIARPSSVRTDPQALRYLS